MGKFQTDFGTQQHLVPVQVKICASDGETLIPPVSPSGAERNPVPETGWKDASSPGGRSHDPVRKREAPCPTEENRTYQASPPDPNQPDSIPRGRNTEPRPPNASRNNVDGIGSPRKKRNPFRRTFSYSRSDDTKEQRIRFSSGNGMERKPLRILRNRVRWDGLKFCPPSSAAVAEQTVR